VGYATTSYVTTQINNLINGAPGLLDTLDELAAALGDDANFAATLTTSLSGKQASLSGTGFIKASGTTITYDNSTYALDSAVVKLTGTQTVGGTKTFTSQIITDIQVVSPAFKVQNSGNTSLYSMLLSYSSGVRIVGLPDKDGTIAMTSDIPTLSSLGGQPALSGTGFVKISGTTISYDNSTYLTTASATSTYLPLAGGTLTGPLVGTTGKFSTGLGVSGYGGNLNSASMFVLDFFAGNSRFYSLGADASTKGGYEFHTNSSNGSLDVIALAIANTGTATFSSDVVLSAANPFVYGGTAAGGVGLSNIGGQTYIKVYGASHATLANVTQFVNGSSTSFTISSAGVTNFNSRVNVNGAADNALYALNVYGDATFNGTRAAPAYIYAIRGGDDSKLILRAGSTAGYFSQLDVSGWNGTGTPAYISLNSGSGTGIYVKLGNNIGIGTVTPSAKLDVYAGSDATSNLVLWGQTIRNEGNGAATGYGAGLKLKVSSDGTPNEVYKWAGIAAVAGTGYSNRTDLALYTNTASTVDATEKVRITGDGSFGIGTNAPARTFHVMGQAAFDMTSTGVVIQSNGTVSEIVSYKQTGSTYADLHLRGANLGIAIKASSGYVGIGTNSPSGCFHVYQSAASDIYLETGTGGTSGKLIFKTSDNSDLNKYIAQEAYYMMFSSNANEGFKWRDSNSNVLMALFGSNNAYGSRLGIGTTTPSANLHVNANSGLLTKDILTVQGGGSPSGNFGFSVKANNGDKIFYTDNLTYNVFSNTAGGKFGIGTTDFSDITFGSSALKIGGSRATLGLTSSGTLSTIALVASNNTATGMHLNFENTGAFRWYSYVSAGETFTLLGNGRLGLGVSSPDARLHVGGPILVSNNSQTYRRAITCYGQTGSYTQIKVHFNKTSWGSVTYDIKLASAGGSHHTAGGYYSNPGLGSHVNSINTGTGITMTFAVGSQSGDTQGATWTFTGATFIHPILTIDIGCGNGYQVNPDDIVVVYT